MKKNIKVGMNLSPKDIDSLVKTLKQGKSVTYTIRDERKDMDHPDDVMLTIKPDWSINENDIYVEIPNKFTTDGCSGYMTKLWKFFTGKVPPWNDCCKEHDIPYHKGGTKEERIKADKGLRKCVKNKGYKVIAWGMEKAVRMGGHPLLPTSWRWGYGYKYPKQYTKKK